jgi:hypothetical protein
MLVYQHDMPPGMNDLDCGMEVRGCAGHISGVDPVTPSESHLGWNLIVCPHKGINIVVSR